MQLIYKNKKIEGKECKNFIDRLKGFMLQKNIKTFLYFNHCNSIHTFFMKENIDVILCDKNNTILYYYKNLPPNKIIFPKKKVSKIYELPTNYFNFKEKEKVEIKQWI